MKGGCDLGVRCPLAESDEDLLLAGGQLLEAASGVCVGGVLFDDWGVEQSSGDRRREEGSLTRGGMHSCEEVAGVSGFEHEAVCAGSYGLHDVDVDAEGCEETARHTVVLGCTWLDVLR